MIKDINPGLGDVSNANFMSGQYFAVMDSILYFAADGGGNNIELWRSNGTESGTYLVKDFAAGASSIPEFITSINGSIYFRVKNANAERELWKSNGTDAGSVLLKQMWVRAFEYTNMFIEYDGYIYFAGDDDNANDLELWRTDGTPEGTELFINLNTSEGKGSNPHNFHILNGKLFFTARPGNSNDVLFISDGTPEGTLQFPNNSSELNAPFLIPAESKLYFDGNNGVNNGLWVTDGTSEGTIFLSAAGPEYFATVVTGNNIVYRSKDEENGCYTLFQSNGTVEGTFQSVECAELSYPSEMISYKGKVLLNGTSDAYGSELFQFTPEFAPVDPGTGIADNKQQHGLFIYPNPATTKILLKRSNFIHNQKIYILNSLGVIILTSTLQSQTQTIDISDLAQGIYFIKIDDSFQKLVVK
jgi:ELWxxDGT repeat protein